MSRGPHQPDVLVVGGGAAGCATALSLVDRGLDPARVIVVEASDYQHERIGESIPPDTGELFESLGLLAAFLAEGHEPCVGSASSWGDDELGYNDFVYNPHGHGWHLDRRRFDRWLCGEVQKRGVTVRRGLRFLGVAKHGPAGAVLEFGASLESGRRRVRLGAAFVVDATGARSRLARRMGAVQRSLDLLVSVAAFLRLPQGASFARLTYLEAVEYGWWYTARLPAGRIATAVATSHEIYKQRRLARPPTWMQALSGTRHLAGVLAGCEPVAGSFSVCTAPSFVLDRVAGECWLAVGDAASAFDPISSQGIFKALCDGLLAGRAISAHLAGGRSTAALQEFQAGVEGRFQEYARQRAYLYRREQRWPGAPFWQQRLERRLDARAVPH